jgi:hypothetical protein
MTCLCKHRGEVNVSLQTNRNPAGSQHHAPAALPPGNARHSLHRRLDGPGFDAGTIQPVASRFTDKAIHAATIYT